MGHQYKILQILSELMNVRNHKVLRSPIASKRVQICEAIPLVETSITVLVDDDVAWLTTTFPYIQRCPAYIYRYHLRIYP
jgi:hypothetical protein